LPVLFHGPCLVIGMIEFGLKSAEKLCHGYIRFAVSIVNSRVNKAWRAILVNHKIPAPKITMDKSRFFGRDNIVQRFEEGIEKSCIALAECTFITSFFQLGLDALLDKETVKISMLFITLSKRSDIIIMIETKIF